MTIAYDLDDDTPIADLPYTSSSMSQRKQMTEEDIRRELEGTRALVRRRARDEADEALLFEALGIDTDDHVRNKLSALNIGQKVI